MNIEDIKRIISNGTEEEKNSLRDYFKKYGNTLELEKEVHEILVDVLLKLDSDEIVKLSGIIGHPVFLRIALYPEIRHSFPLLQDGASLVVLDDEDRVLVQQRMDNGKYGFSGGCQELGEDLATTGIRECDEETGLLLDRDSIINLCEVSGMSRKNSYPNGDVVVNNTALYVGYLKDATGELRKDFESKQVMFKDISFLEDLPEEEKHERDTIEILSRFISNRNVNLEQERITVDVEDKKDTETFVDYMLRISPDDRIKVSKKMGYDKFLEACIDKRIWHVFPHFIDKGVLMSVVGDEILVEVKGDNVSTPKRIQSVGESFVNLLEESFKVSSEDLVLMLRMSLNNINGDNAYYNSMIYSSKSKVLESDTLKYLSINDVYGLLSEEDRMYYDEYKKKIEGNNKKLSR